MWGLIGQFGGDLGHGELLPSMFPTRIALQVPCRLLAVHVPKGSSTQRKLETIG